MKAADAAREAERVRRVEVLRHLGWRSAYAPARDCAHTDAVEIENEEPVVRPDPMPEFWIPLRLRHWTCAYCGTAVNPHHVKNRTQLPDPGTIAAHRRALAR